MPYSIRTQDGIVINGIPDDMPPDSDILRQRVADERSKLQQGEQQPSQQEEQGILSSAGDMVGDYYKQRVGDAEALMAMSSGSLPTMAVAGVAGLGQAAANKARQFFGDESAGGKTGAEMSQSVENAMTYEPRTEAGKERMQQLSGVAEMLPDVAGKAGEITLDVTESPAAATGVDTVLTLLPELLSLGAIRKMRVGTKLIDESGNPTKELRKELDRVGLNFDNLSDEARSKIPAVADQEFLTGKSLVPKATQDALVEQIKSGGRDDSLAALRVVDDKVMIDPLGAEATRQGFAPGFVQSIKTATPETRLGMAKQVKIMRQIKSQERKGLDIRPGNVVGEALTKRVKVIRNAASDAAKELDVIVQNSLKNKPINVDTVYTPFTAALDDLGITLKKDDNGAGFIDFSDSIITKDKASMRAVQDAVDLLADAQRRGTVTAYDAHRLKRQFDNIIDFRKKSSEGLSEDGRKVLKKVRAALNESVREISPDYARVNDVMSKSLTALDDFDKATGASIDIFGEGANSAIGTKMRTLMSNLPTRVNLENSVYQLDDVARELNSTKGKGLIKYDGVEHKPSDIITLNDDIKDLTMVANALDARFGAVAKSSLSANLEQSINRVLNQGVSQEVLQQGAGSLVKVANKVRGVDDFNAFEAIDALIKKGDK